MRGYGEVSRRAAFELDAIVSRLLELLADLDTCVNSGTGREIKGEQPHES